MDEELSKIIIDYFDPGDFAEFIGITTAQLLEEFPDEVEDAIDEIKEIIQIHLPHLDPEEESGDDE